MDQVRFAAQLTSIGATFNLDAQALRLQAKPRALQRLALCLRLYVPSSFDAYRPEARAGAESLPLHCTASLPCGLLQELRGLVGAAVLAL